MLPSGLQGMFTSWAGDICQTSPGQQGPADTITWPSGRLGSSSCARGGRPRTPAFSLTATLPRMEAATLPAARSSPARASRAGRAFGSPSRPTPSSLCRRPNSRGPERPGEAGGAAEGAAPSCRPREPVSPCTSAKAPTGRRPQRPNRPRSLGTTLQTLPGRTPAAPAALRRSRERTPGGTSFLSAVSLSPPPD